MMFEIEKEVYGKDGSSTYYFRESTIDKKLIRDIDNYGYETGFHYEEIATFEKKNKNKSSDAIRLHIPQCRKLFLKDINNFRSSTGSPSKSVASHGDFINVKYHISNWELLTDVKTREEGCVLVEAYDNSIMQYVQARYADQILLSDFADSVINGINKKQNIIMTLTHPRNWKVDVVANTKDNLLRVWQGLKYKI